jgi:4-amino-4-deoxy-L-arabinose transferase-like glycosyltransferase
MGTNLVRTDRAGKPLAGMLKVARMKHHEHLRLIGLLALVLAVRLGFLGFFQSQVFSGPSTQFEQAFVATNLVDGKGLQIFHQFPATLEASDSTQMIDPERYETRSPALQPYIREVPGYALFLAGVWTLFGAKRWIYAQIVQVTFEVFAAWGLYALTKKFFGQKAGWLTVLVFAFLFYEARVSVVPSRDIFLLYLMLIITLCASRIFLHEGRPWIWFFVLCVVTGVGYYFTPMILLYPLFLTLMLWIMKRVTFRMAVAFLVTAVTVVGLMVWPYQSYVHAHRNDPEITPPLFWYNLWLGNQVSTFYSTQEERFQDYFRDKTRATGKNIEEICREEFLAYVQATPIPYLMHTLKKLLYGTFLVYGNAGDATYPRSWNYFKTQHPQAAFSTYVLNQPMRIVGMVLGTLSASMLFPTALVALFLLVREKRASAGFFFFTVPLYFLLILMFFHYEARYLTGTLVGYLPLAGFTLSRLRVQNKSSGD